jgi:hypothetical protein
MEMACSFLNCIRGDILFKNLGLLIGANPRRLSTWVPVVKKIRKKLNSWGNKHISLGGRLVLINSVLNSIPIFYLSFMKMPTQVIKKVTRIQREFLWGGVNGGKNLSWIKWKVVCQEKNNGGLGVRDIKAVNLSLLMKWRLLQMDDRAIWKEVLVAKYGDHILFDVELSNGPPPYFSSLWWKDICALENSVGSRRWLEEVVVRRIGNGDLTWFWDDKWHGDSPLSVKFPRLFSLTLKKEVSVREMTLDVEGDSCSWNFHWRRALFQWKEDSVAQLVALFESVELNSNEDKWRWGLYPERHFLVKTAFDSISKEIVEGSNLNLLEKKIFHNIWNSPTPSKVVAFSWQLLYDRVPTKENLLLRGVLQHRS